MFCKTQDFSASDFESIAKWLSCNGDVWGVGPTAVFASAAALFLYHELEATIFLAGDGAHVSMLEHTLISSMVLGMLALMIHLWVCSMRFFQYYLDTIICDSPGILLEMTTAGLLGSQAEMVPLGPLFRFLKQQQPQIHITVCWFLSLCYADYVRKNYCQRFNMPYLEQWQARLHDRASRGVKDTIDRVNSFVGSVHQRLRGFAPITPSQHNQTFNTKIWMGGGPENECGMSNGNVPVGKEVCVRLVSQSSETAADAIEKLRTYVALVEWAKCGEGQISMLPTILWTLGASLLAHRLLSAVFRRFLFRRVPLWELVLQNLLFIWVVIYSLHFWNLLVKVIKIVVDYCYEDISIVQDSIILEELNGRKMMQQWIVWMCGMFPLAFFIHTQPRPESPPLMIWITTSPWQRREMGAYGYYLNRPLSSLPTSSPTGSSRRQAFALRRAFSDSTVILKEPAKKKRYSKSV